MLVSCVTQLAKMAASISFSCVKSCSRLLRHGYSAWPSVSSRCSGNKVMAVAGARFYRGSNRDTRRRERNLLEKQRKREGQKPRVFDKREFMRENYEKELFAFRNRLSLVFEDERLLRTALTHELCEEDLVKDKEKIEENSKLALLGHNLTSQYITEYLCFKYPNLPSEGVRQLHNFLTNRETLVKVADLTALPELIKTKHDLDSLDKEKHVEVTKEDVISDAFLALIGAIYLDQGSSEANKFVRDFLITQLYTQELNQVLQFENPEALLESMVLSEGHTKPEARITRQSGKATHLPVYVVGLFCGEELIGEAAGYNLVNAKREAVNAALMRLVQRGMHQEPTLPSDQMNYKPALTQNKL
ncbi:39S ribosomal protein L44, mitochondrial [Nematostella vectensis]|uniref:39S ribosomal protein L44, mitochondrial n=1 Tax=Nematostella vectensis TaxID=45351 RepID=UPI0020775216|nr:39S ribosomal protein L44, mitochondrial [Nematostella vectensis]